jgi:hypothetical protein
MVYVLNPSKTLAKAWVADTASLPPERADGPDQIDEHWQPDRNPATV